MKKKWIIGVFSGTAILAFLAGILRMFLGGRSGGDDRGPDRGRVDSQLDTVRRNNIRAKERINELEENNRELADNGDRLAERLDVAGESVRKLELRNDDAARLSARNSSLLRELRARRRKRSTKEEG